MRALEEKRIAGAALDVYEREPLVEPGLINLANVVLTPHLGSAALDTREKVAAILVDNAIAVIEGRRPPNLYNPEIYEPITLFLVLHCRSFLLLRSLFS